jgi:hypothetical protein
LDYRPVQVRREGRFRLRSSSPRSSVSRKSTSCRIATSSSR